MDVSCEKPRIVLSVISHGDAGLIERLLVDVDCYCRDLDITVVLTENIAETSTINAQRFSFPLRRIRNASPLNFGANHNQAFASEQSDYFCVVNPGISFNNDPITPLLEAMKKDMVAAAAPLIYGPDGELQDTVRKNVTFKHLFSRLVSSGRENPNCGVRNVSSLDIDWAAAIFLLVRSKVFRQVGGFAEGDFMYGEDASLCARLHAGGGRLCLVPDAEIMHLAKPSSQRETRRLSGRVLGLLRFFS